MKATESQKHSVRGFFAGLVRKKLQLKLAYEKIGDKRALRIEGGSTVQDRTAAVQTSPHLTVMAWVRIGPASSDRAGALLVLLLALAPRAVWRIFGPRQKVQVERGAGLFRMRNRLKALTGSLLGRLISNKPKSLPVSY